MSYAQRTAREAPPEHGRAFGVVQGTMEINERLRRVLAFLRTKEAQRFMRPTAQSDLELLPMLTEAQRQQVRSLQILAAIEQVIGL